MSIIQLSPQFRPEDKHTSQSLTLDGVRFQLVTYTNKADNGWYMDLLDINGNAVVKGIGMAVGLDLLYPYRYKGNLPPGILFLQDLAGTREDPVLASFENEDVGLYYQEVGG